MSIFRIFKEIKQSKLSFGANAFSRLKAIVFVGCSIVSAFINLIFIANLTKSPYTLGTLFSVPAAIFLGTMSIFLDLSKSLHVIQVNTLQEMYRQCSSYNWASRVKQAMHKWTAIYILYVILSIITSVSLSSISIGEGIHRNQSTINQITKDISKLQKYANTDEASENIQLNSLVESVSNSTNAVKNAQATFNAIQPIITEYRKERADFTTQFGADGFGSKDVVTWNEQDIVPDTYWDDRNARVMSDIRANGVSLTISEIRNLSDQDIQLKIKEAQEQLTSNTSTDELIAFTEKTKSKYEQEIENLNGKYFYPSVYNKDGTVTQEPVDFTGVSLSKAISILENLKVKYENDKGDIGDSSKIFMQVGSAIDSFRNKESSDLIEASKKVSVSSFGTTELLMMGMLLFLSLLCELAINQFSPKVQISREMLGEFSYLLPKKFDVDKFMDELEADYAKFITRPKPIEQQPVPEPVKEADVVPEEKKPKVKRTLKLRKEKKAEEPVEKPIEEPAAEQIAAQAAEEVSVNNNSEGYSTAVDDAVNEIEELLNR